jgi:hypothetical protein
MAFHLLCIAVMPFSTGGNMMSDELTFTPKNRKDWRRWLAGAKWRERNFCLAYLS